METKFVVWRPCIQKFVLWTTFMTKDSNGFLDFWLQEPDQILSISPEEFSDPAKLCSRLGVVLQGIKK